MDNRTLVDVVESLAKTSPEHVIYTFCRYKNDDLIEETLTYLALSQKAKALALRMNRRVQPGDRVLLIFEPGLDFIIAFYACLYAGVIAIPVYPPLTLDAAAKLNHITQDAKPTLALTTLKNKRKLTFLRLIKFLSQFSWLEKLFTLVWKEKFIHLKKLMRWPLEHTYLLKSDKLSAKVASKWRMPKINEDTIAFLQYTSGSTAQPKGVILSHKNILNNLEIIKDKMKLQPRQDVAVFWLPPYHDMGLIAGILEPLYVHGQVKLFSPLAFLQKPIRWLELISHYRANISGAPDFAYSLCTKKIKPQDKQHLDLRHWEIAFTGAEPIRLSTLKKFAKAFSDSGFSESTFLPCYGLAEVTLMATCREKGKGAVYKIVNGEALQKGQFIPQSHHTPQDRTIVSSGSPGLDVDIVIVNPDTFKACEPSEIGEIWVAGKAGSSGYWNQPAETQKYFHAYLENGKGPFLRTGDLGCLFENELYVTGRIKDLIIIRGKNYYPQDIEHTIQESHSSIRLNRCVVFTLDDQEQLVVVQEIKGDAYPFRQEIAAAIRKDILHYHGILPEKILLVGQKTVPKTTSNKVQRRLCKQLYVAGKLNILYSDENAFNSQDELFEMLLNQFDEDHMDPNSAQKKLSEWGLDSMKIVELQVSLQQRFQVPLPLSYFLSDPTLLDIFNKVKKPGPIDSLESHIDLAMEVEQYKLVNAHPRTLALATPQTIFLTGCTGFLGTYILHELIKQTSCVLYCLVKPHKDTISFERIERSLKRYGFSTLNLKKRVRIIEGDITANHFGLSVDVYKTLQETIDIIIHSAAVLNFCQPYGALKAPNVLGTHAVIQLATTGKVKMLHYVSTLGFFLGALNLDSDVLTEETRLTSKHKIQGGYNQSKWVAEELIHAAKNAGVPTMIYRAGLIVAEANTGKSNDQDIFNRLVKSCLKLKAAPQLFGKFNLVPVDFVAKAIVASVLHKAHHETLHLINPQSIALPEIVDTLNTSGYGIRVISYKAWRSEMIEFEMKYKNSHLLYPLLPFFTADTNPSLFELYTRADLPNILAESTFKKLARYGIQTDFSYAKIVSHYGD